MFVFLKQKASVQHSETPPVPTASPRVISDPKTARCLPPSLPPGPAQGALGTQAGRSAASPSTDPQPSGAAAAALLPGRTGNRPFPRTGVQRFQPALRRAVTEPRQRAAGPRGRRLRPSVPRPRLKQCRAAAFPSSRLPQQPPRRDGEGPGGGGGRGRRAGPEATALPPAASRPARSP